MLASSCSWSFNRPGLKNPFWLVKFLASLQIDCWIEWELILSLDLLSSFCNVKGWTEIINYCMERTLDAHSKGEHLCNIPDILDCHSDQHFIFQFISKSIDQIIVQSDNSTKICKTWVGLKRRRAKNWKSMRNSYAGIGFVLVGICLFRAF